jgi:hypothetical protein
VALRHDLVAQGCQFIIATHSRYSRRQQAGGDAGR